MSSVRSGLVAALLLATLTSCGLPVPGTASGTPSAPTAGPLTENASQPAMEESPQPQPQPQPKPDGNPGKQPEKPWVSVPTMPAGGREDFPDNEPPPGVHCLQSSNLGNVDIPPEVTLTITEITIVQGAKYFRSGGSGCSTPLCAPGFRWTEDKSNCYIPVTEQGDWSNSTSHKITILLSGRASCPPGQRAPCEEYRDRIAGSKTDVGDDISSSRPEPTQAPTSTTADPPPTATEDASPSATN